MEHSDTIAAAAAAVVLSTPTPSTQTLPLPSSLLSTQSPLSTSDSLATETTPLLRPSADNTAATDTNGQSLEAFRERLRRVYLQPAIEQDVATLTRSRFCLRRTGDATEFTAHCLIGVGAVVTFAGGYFNSSVLSFVGASATTVSLVLLKLSSMSMKESRERNDELNRLLEQQQIPIRMPDIVIDSAGS